jgi:DNA-binding NtrC family response regulator
VIEDDESVLDALKRMLKHFGYAIISASNGEKAIEIYLVEQERIDLVILSLNMPGMGGRKCLEKMLEIKPDLKTIVTSGYSSATSIEDINKSGTFAFIEKPYQLEDLLRTIRKVVDG